MTVTRYPLQGTPRIMKLLSTSTLSREVLCLQDSEELVAISEFKPVAGNKFDLPLV